MIIMNDPKRATVVAFTVALLCAGSCTHSITEQTSVVTTCWGFARVVTHFFNMWCVMALWHVEKSKGLSRYRMLFVALLTSGIVELYNNTTEAPLSPLAPWGYAWCMELVCTLISCWVGAEPEMDGPDGILLQVRMYMFPTVAWIYAGWSLISDLWDVL